MTREGNLVNRRVVLSISDPWDFGTECGTGPFKGTIYHVDDEQLVVRLDDPIVYCGKLLHTGVVRARHAGQQVDTVRCHILSANILLLPLDVVEVSPSTDTRTGVSVIGAVEQLT